MKNLAFPFKGLPSRQSFYLMGLFRLWGADSQENSVAVSCDSNDVVTSLILSGNHPTPLNEIEDLLTQIPLLFPFLTVFSLKYNFMTYPFPFISELQHLSHLIIGGNSLSTFSPGFFIYLPNLEKLIIDRSLIKSLPPEICSLDKLCILSLSNSPYFTEFDIDFSKFPLLYKIELENTAITSIPDSLLQCPNLQSIYIEQEVKIQYIPQKLRSIITLVN